MATLEKPKEKKTRKSTKPLIQEDNDDVVTKNDAITKEEKSKKLQTFLNSRPADKETIISKECFIASDYKKSELKENDEEKVEEKGELTKPASDILEDIEPTAPPASLDTVTSPPLTENILIQYPNLVSLQNEQEESPSKVVFTSPGIRTLGSRLTCTELEPFNEEELKQFYHCAELQQVEQFELEFLMNSLLEPHDSDPLYNALQQYYILQSKLTMNAHDITKFRQKAETLKQTIWTPETITKTCSGRCGCGTEVKETVTYTIMKVDEAKRLDFISTLGDSFGIITETYITNLINAKIENVKIEHIIDDIINFPLGNNVPKCQGDHRLQQSLDENELHCATHVRTALKILFHFARKLSPNKNFADDLKVWLQRVISFYLLMATKEDHWFLILNILRCPSGVGNWASEFIQLPCSTLSKNNNKSVAHTNNIPLPLHSPEIKLCMSVLKVLLMPIAKRNEYLADFSQSHKEITDPVKEERWTLIDSEGEDEHTPTGDCVGLKENDLIALLNQIPFKDLFRSALAIEKFLGDYILEADLITAQQILQVLSFFQQLVDLFGQGMLTYNTERYKHLAKRLGRLMRHALQYFSAYLELFKNNNIGKDKELLERLARQYNVFIMKGCSYIYRTRNLATWQYFSLLPYHDMGTDTIWEIFYYLNVGFPTEFTKPHEDFIELVTRPAMWSKFNVANADSSAEDLYYLLQAFFEMANDRDSAKDWDLIKTVFLHIFQIGYINHYTREICYKAARDMLVNLALCYGDLMSCLLTHLKVCFSSTENVDYLYKALPLENWKPDMTSFEILSNWLLHFDFKSSENLLARLIISHLNWGFDVDQRLFLPHNIHIRMACLISEALTKHAPEVIGVSGISESVRQVTNLIDFSPVTKEQFSSWCWSIVSLLRLHLMDQNVQTVKKVLQNPAEGLMFTPELERVDLIYQGVTDNRPLAVYVGILVSLHGHSIPLICQKGLELIQRLLHDHRHAAVIRCLELIVPLFLEIPDTLANTNAFHNILLTLLNADKTYLKMAKDVIYPNRVGPVLELLENMIHHQITYYPSYGLTSPLNLINVWLNCLTALPNWQNTYVVYILDKILQIAFQFPDAYHQTIEYFTNYYKECNDWKISNRGLKGLFSNYNLKIPVISGQHPWLALALLEIEFRCQDSLMWMEFLRQLRAAGSKTNLETVLKKTFQITKLPAYPADKLCLYKYATLLASMDINRPLYPIIGQKFFELYLARVPAHHNDNSFQQIFGVADKFYDYNIPLMKLIKNNLKAAEILYKNEATKNAKDDALAYHYRNCSKLIQSYLVWLEDTSINKFSNDVENFHPQYNSDKLKQIFDGCTQYWMEYIYLPAIRKEQRYQAEQWMRKCYRLNDSKPLHIPIVSRTKTFPIESIKLLLNSYDKRLPPPEYVKPAKCVELNITKHTIKDLVEKLTVLKNTASNFDHKIAELNSLQGNYSDHIVKLYQMQPYEEMCYKGCSARYGQCNCPASIVKKMEKVHKDVYVEQKLNNYQERHDEIINGMLNAHVDGFALSVQEIQTIARMLLNMAGAEKLCNDIGVEFFYNIVENMDDIVKKFKATNRVFSDLLNDLGEFIKQDQEKQGLNVLKVTLKRPDLLEQLSAAFAPSHTRPQFFIENYKFLIDSYLKQYDINTLFVLFSKFDLVTWLQKYRPKLFDINDLLLLILQGLECWSHPSPPSQADLLQDLFRRHLVHIFQYDFPEHYGEVMELILQRSSDQKLMPVVLLDLLNSLLISCGCEQMSHDASHLKINDIAITFSTRQNLFTLKAATDTALMFGQHFQRERLRYGLHGLYPRHHKYCQVLSMWFYCFGHCIVVKAICTYQDLLADQICDIVFGSIIDMYAPWLIIYTEETIRERTSNWLRELADSGTKKMLFPWSKQYVPSSHLMLKSFTSILKYTLGNLPISQKILGHTFAWYIHHFAVLHVESYIYEPLHENIANLPWELFKPNVDHIQLFYDSLSKFIPESHAMLAHIFIRIDWKQWFSETFVAIPKTSLSPTMSRLFTIFVKIAFEPNIHIHINTSKILEEANKYPWNLVEYTEIENLLKWFSDTIEPSVVLKIPEESNYVDRAVLDLIALCCGIKPKQLNDVAQLSQKRLLYTKWMVCLQRACITKNPKLLTTKVGRSVVAKAFIDLIKSLNESLTAIKSREEQKIEAHNIMLEILLPMQTQSEETSNVHLECLKNYICNIALPGNIFVCSILSGIGAMKALIRGIYHLLETTIYFYFRSSQSSLDWHTPTWTNLLQLVKGSLDKLELMPIMSFNCFLTLNVFILYKMEKLATNGDRITFLQDLSQLVTSLKTEPQTEPELAVVWGCMIAWSCKIHLSEPVNVKKPLYMLARHLQAISNQPQGWSDGLLGAIGFKKDIVTSLRKVLTRCLAIMIFAMFPINREKSTPNDEYCSAMRELSMLLANKKFSEVKPLIVQVVGILNENPMPQLKDVPYLICRLINVLYRGNAFLTTLPEIWQLDFFLSGIC